MPPIDRGPKVPRKPKIVDNERTEAPHERWARIDRTKRIDPGASREEIQNQRRLERLAQFPMLKQYAKFAFRGTHYEVFSVNPATGFVRCKELGEGKRMWKEINVLRIQPEDIESL
jgi:hypothetical protein